MASEMYLDFLPNTVSNIIRQVSMMDDLSERSSALEFYINAIEAEVQKLDGFKRELPLCMQLLKDGLEMLKEERLKWKGKRSEPVVEEFIPLKGDGIGRAKASNDVMEKQHWMKNAKLFPTTVEYEEADLDVQNRDSLLHLKSRYPQEKGYEQHDGPFPKHNGNFKNRGGAFVPFKRPCGVTIKDDKRSVFPTNHGLTPLAPAHTAASDEVEASNDIKAKKPQMSQPERKQRRCWSPELHKLFVDALQQLGGAQAATPKQIRELMKVDGLTNDEVKSHLQKYRIHLRKLPTLQLGDLSWLPQNDPLKLAMASSSGSPHGHSNANEGSSSKAKSEEEEKSESRSYKSQFMKPEDDGGL